MAYLVGDVAVGERSSLWPFVCLRGDHGPVTVGDDTNVQEFTMLHGAEIGDRVSVGHGATIDFASVADDVLVGMGSRVLSGASVESNCIVAANAVVRNDQTIPEGHLAYGVPAETRPLTDGQRERIQDNWRHYTDLGERFVADGPHERP
ncbi:carbonic anhydrase, family 3 [Halarchaeum acidiphilum MH1-52-1]|uniref:Carbonic anhydrase, family 3 n=2 Tax=Halarchaeum acidiphilum TaxID=489138 RepID=U2YYI3_9EURY|nr:carbonic anhydrase, family 3 [Halarchaeum acidiphilum MH1-52-1]